MRETDEKTVSGCPTGAEAKRDERQGDQLLLLRDPHDCGERRFLSHHLS
jgi:hypothetical protein